MIQAWLIREEYFVNPETLMIFSQDLAVDIYSKREARGMERIGPSEAMTLVRQSDFQLEAWQLRGRSLLNRDGEGNYKFAHRAFMEYLFVLKFMRDANSVPKQEWTDQMKTFWWEQLVSLYQGDRPEVDSSDGRTVQVLLDRGVTLADITGMQTLPLPRMCSLPSSPHSYAGNWELIRICQTQTQLFGTTNQRAKLIPGLFQRFELPDFGSGSASNEVVVDFATRLMWQSDCTRQVTYEEVPYVPHERVTEGNMSMGHWRAPTLQEALSLLPNVAQSESTHPSSYFKSWEVPIWTSDTVTPDQKYTVFEDVGFHVACFLSNEQPARSKRVFQAVW